MEKKRYTREELDQLVLAAQEDFEANFPAVYSALESLMNKEADKISRRSYHFYTPEEVYSDLEDALINAIKGYKLEVGHFIAFFVFKITARASALLNKAFRTKTGRGYFNTASITDLDKELDVYLREYYAETHWLHQKEELLRLMQKVVAANPSSKFAELGINPKNAVEFAFDKFVDGWHATEIAITDSPSEARKISAAIKEVQSILKNSEEFKRLAKEMGIIK